MSQLKTNAIRHTTATSDAITLASDGTATANVTNNLSNRNLIINGAMQIAQRSTSTASVSTDTFVLDRFNANFATGQDGGTYTVSQSTESPSGFGNSMKIDCTTAVASPAAAASFDIRYKMEGFDLQRFAKGTSDAKAFILSFYVKTNVTGVYAVSLRDLDNTRLVQANYTVGNTNWNRYTVTFPADTTGAFGNDNGGSSEIQWALVAGTNYTSGSAQTTWGSYTAANHYYGHAVNMASNTSNEFHITGVQLEVDNTGSGVATDFEHRSYGSELALCQRYYWQTSFQRTAYAYRGDYRLLEIDHPVQMRAIPTATLTGGTASSFSTYTNSQQVLCFRALISAAYDLNSAKYVDSATFSAEL